MLEVEIFPPRATIDELVNIFQVNVWIYQRRYVRSFSLIKITGNLGEDSKNMVTT